MPGWRRSLLLPAARVAAVVSSIALPGCPVGPEGESSEIRALVRYEIEVAQGFDVFEIQGMGTFCRTPEFEWVINKRLSVQGNPTAIDRVFSFSSGRPDEDGHCILSLGPWAFLTPGEYRVVATDYDWIAKCEATLIALETSGSFQNVRFVKGSDGCEVSVQPLPP